MGPISPMGLMGGMGPMGPMPCPPPQKSSPAGSNSSYGFCEKVSKRVYLSNQASLMSTSVGPFRCLATMMSAWPWTLHLLGFLAGMIHFLAVDEHHHVGVLLDGPRLAEVAQLADGGPPCPPPPAGSIGPGKAGGYSIRGRGISAAGPSSPPALAAGRGDRRAGSVAGSRSPKSPGPASASNAGHRRQFPSPCGPACRR